MAHYRKIDVAMWNDAKFCGLPPLSKLAFLFLITHPNMTSIGAMRATVPGLAAELGVSQDEFTAVADTGMAKFDRSACCAFLPNFLRYQTAESPNVIRNWVKQLDFVPAGQIRDEAVASLESYVKDKPEGFRKAFREAFAKSSAKASPKASAKTVANLPQRNAKDFPESVSSKQLPVSSKPPYPFQGEEFGGVDVHTGEIFAAGGEK